MKPGLSRLKSDSIGSILYSGFPCEHFMPVNHGPIKLYDDAYSEGRALNGPGLTSGYRSMPTKFKLQTSINLSTSKTSKPVNYKKCYFSSLLLLPSQEVEAVKADDYTLSSNLRNILIPLRLISHHCPASY